MPRTPAEQAIYLAERPIYDAAASLDKYAAMATALRAGLARVHLPVAAAAEHLDYMDDLLAIVSAQLNRAANVVNAELERLQKAEEARYALADRAQATIGRLVTVAPGIERKMVAANDDGQARLAASLRGGVL